FEMLTGRAPYAEETTARGVWRRMNEIPVLPDELVETLPAGLEDLIARALDPDPKRRPTMTGFAASLADPKAPSTPEAFTRRLRRRPPLRRRSARRQARGPAAHAASPSSGHRRPCDARRRARACAQARSQPRVPR